MRWGQNVVNGTDGSMGFTMVGRVGMRMRCGAGLRDGPKHSYTYGGTAKGYDPAC